MANGNPQPETLAGPQGALTAASQESQRPLVIFHPSWQDRFLCHIEILLVTLLALFVIFVIVGSGVWIASGWPQPIAERFAMFLNTINKSWKVGLLISIPLVFRPIRLFLENLKKVGGAERFPQHQVEQPDPQRLPPGTSA